MVARAGEARGDVTSTQSSGTLANQAASVLFPGLGALSISTIETNLAFATFAGVGALSANITKAPNALSATFNGSSASSIYVNQCSLGFASFGGSGSLSPNAIIPSGFAAATFAGAGIASFAAEKLIVGETNFAGAGTLELNTTATLPAFTQLDGISGLEAYASANINSQASFIGSSDLECRVALQHEAEIRLAGVGEVSSRARRIRPGPVYLEHTVRVKAENREVEAVD